VYKYFLNCIGSWKKEGGWHMNSLKLIVGDKNV